MRDAAASPQIELVIFDVDGVLAHLDRARRLALLAHFTGRPPEVVDRVLYRSDFERGAEAGAYASGDAYLAELNRRLETSLAREAWIGARRQSMTPIAETLAIARSLARSTRIATLTNNGPLLREAIDEIFPEAAALFGETFVASCELGSRKPDPEVFARLAARFGIPVGRALFVDDDASYVAGARSAGLQAVAYRGADALRRALTRAGLRAAGVDLSPAR